LEVVYLHYLDALLDGDKQQCLNIVKSLIEQKISVKEIYLELFQRSMYRIGQMWEKERCSIADEHIATKITETMIEFVANNYPCVSKNGKQALVTCIDKEYHELGARMIAGFLETVGWKTIFIGANIPQEEILYVIRKKNPDMIGISSSFYINIKRLIDLLEKITIEFPEQEIIVGGQSLMDGGSECLSKFNNIHYIPCLDNLEEYLSKYHHN
jgi:MerR family transcriptional regulator, light-induced transcriptional regulator